MTHLRCLDVFTYNVNTGLIKQGDKKLSRNSGSKTRHLQHIQ